MSPSLLISDEGRAFKLDYTGLLTYHGGGALAGATIGFRVMQAAAECLTTSGAPWERQGVHIVSGHPGPGYRDAFEYVTRCVTRKRFEVKKDLPGGRHSPYQAYAFQFLVTDIAARKQAVIILRDGIMPMRFFEVLRDLKSDTDHPALLAELEAMKNRIAEATLQRSLDELFQVQLQDPDTGR